jgi:hypothetical protein
LFYDSKRHILQSVAASPHSGLHSTWLRMTTIIVDDDFPGSWTPKDENFVQPTIQAQLAEKFSPEADFYSREGQPYVVYPQWDYAEDWSAYPIREIHPLAVVLGGTKIAEAEFRTLVKTIHGVT